MQRMFCSWVTVLPPLGLAGTAPIFTELPYHTLFSIPGLTEPGGWWVAGTYEIGEVWKWGFGNCYGQALPTVLSRRSKKGISTLSAPVSWAQLGCLQP